MAGVNMGSVAIAYVEACAEEALAVYARALICCSLEAECLLKLARVFRNAQSDQVPSYLFFSFLFFFIYRVLLPPLSLFLYLLAGSFLQVSYLMTLYSTSCASLCEFELLFLQIKRL
jgi:hypothetical protein